MTATDSRVTTNPMGPWVANLKRSSVFGSPERIGGNGGFTRGQQDRQRADTTADPVGVGAPIPFGVLMEFGGFTQCHTNLRKGAGGRRCSVSHHSGTAPGDSGRWLDPYDGAGHDGPTGPSRGGPPRSGGMIWGARDPGHDGRTGTTF